MSCDLFCEEEYRIVKLRVTFLLLSCAVYCGAQAAAGNIRGTVSDSTGALLPNCSVNIANVSTGFTRTVKTNERGDFNAPSIPVGVYNVTVELTGFQKTALSGVELQVDQTATLPIELKPGPINERVEVQATAPLLET
jgi:hypothetical protein